MMSIRIITVSWRMSLLNASQSIFIIQILCSHPWKGTKELCCATLLALSLQLQQSGKALCSKRFLESTKQLLGPLFCLIHVYYAAELSLLEFLWSCSLRIYLRCCFELRESIFKITYIESLMMNDAVFLAIAF